MFVSFLTHTPGTFESAIDFGLLGSCAIFLICPIIGIIVLCVRAAKGERKHKWVGWILLAVWLLSIFGIIGFGIEMDKREKIEQRIERTAEQWERWFDERDSTATDTTYVLEEPDTTIERTF